MTTDIFITDVLRVSYDPAVGQFAISILTGGVWHSRRVFCPDAYDMIDAIEKVRREGIALDRVEVANG